MATTVPAGNETSEDSSAGKYYGLQKQCISIINDIPRGVKKRSKFFWPFYQNKGNWTKRVLHVLYRLV